MLALLIELRVTPALYPHLLQNVHYKLPPVLSAATTIYKVFLSESDRSNTVSVFNGPAPIVQTFDVERDEIDAVGQWIKDRTEEGLLPHEFGVFVRSKNQLARAKAAVESADLKYKVLDDQVQGATGHVSISTMHLAKGLEFRAVTVMACDDEVIPSQERIETIGDDADLKEIYDTERHLLYVACTRSRDHLIVTGIDPASEFLEDMQL